MKFLSFEWKWLSKIGLCLLIFSMCLLLLVFLSTQTKNYALEHAKGLDMVFVPLMIGGLYQLGSSFVYWRFYQRKHQKLAPLLIASQAQMAALPFVIKLLNGIYTWILMCIAFHIIALGLGKANGMFTQFPDENFMIRVLMLYAFEVLIILDVKICLLSIDLKAVNESKRMQKFIVLMIAAAICFIVGMFAFTAFFASLVWGFFILLTLQYGYSLWKLKRKEA